MDRHDQPRVDEVYTIRQVAERTGVPANTLRSWERRFAFLSPDRTNSNYRRYTERDIATIVAVRDARSRGQSIDQAIREATQGTPIAATPVPTRGIEPAPPNRDDMVTELANALLNWDQVKASRMAADISLSMGTDRACASLYYPTSREIRRRQALGEATSAGAGWAVGWTRRALQRAFAESNPESGHDLVLIAPVLDDSWSDALLTLAVVVSRAGYRVALVDGALEAGGIRECCRGLGPSAAIIASSSPYLTDLTADVANTLGGTSMSLITMGAGTVALEGTPHVSDDVLKALSVLDAVITSNRPKPHLVEIP